MEAGIPPKTVQTILGHAFLDMTMNLYTHVMDDKKDKPLQALNEYYEQIDEDEQSVDESFKRAVNDFLITIVDFAINQGPFDIYNHNPHRLVTLVTA